MRSNYRPIGDFIELVDERNKKLEIDLLLGLSISKVFIPSVANTIGADMANYKIIRKGQFACSIMQVRRDKKMPVALLRDFDEAIISQAYPVFRVQDENVLLPEYLMMWFSRSEFDRHACFLAVGGVRGSLEWEDFLEMELPVPSIEKQRAIVKEYNTVVNRIKLNEKLNQKLEETAQALYKHWFVDFEFPNEEGKPYKSSGGKMVYNEELEKEIPEGWSSDSFTNLFELKGGGTPSTNNILFWDGSIPFFTPKDVSECCFSILTEKRLTTDGLNNCSSRLYNENTVFVTARGTVGAIALAGTEMAMNQSCYAILSPEESYQFFTHQHSINAIHKLKEEAVGAVFKALVTKDFNSCIVLSPDSLIIKNFELTVTPIYKHIKDTYMEIIKSREIKSLILSKMTQVDVEELAIT